MISTEGLSKTFVPRHRQDAPKQALKNISLRIVEGELFGIIGKTHAGKTTLLRCLSLLEKPSQGQICLGQEKLHPLPTTLRRIARRQIAFLPSDPQLLSSRTVYDNVALPLEFLGFEAHEIETLVLSALDQVGLTVKAQAYPQELKLGQQQRVALARALVNRPKVLFCDDPTRHLEPNASQAFLQSLQQIQQQSGITVVLATQDMDVIKTTCDRVAILDQGRFVEEARVVEFFTKPQSDLGKELIRTNSRSEMPQSLRRKMASRPSEGCHYVLRLSFLGQVAQEPLVAQVIQRFDLSVNILQAHLETIRQETVGIMIIEALSQDPSQIPKAIAFLNQKHIHIEILGYVTRTA